jgi:hypothetical protein
METISHPLQACRQVFLRPNRVFATILIKHNWSWFPFLIVMVMAILPSYLYFNFVDFDWYKELIINTNYADISPAEQQNIRLSMNKQQVLSFALVGGGLGYVILNAILAAYLYLSCRSDEENVQGFSDWYGFSWWVSMPGVLAGFLTVLTILLASDNQLSYADTSPTALSYWLGTDITSSWFTYLQTIRVESIWSIYLIAVGISQWTRFNSRHAFIIASAPYLLIWIVWAGFKLS